MRPFHSDSINLDRLHGAAVGIEAAFRPMAGLDPHTDKIERAEFSLRKEIKTVYLHLFALSMADLRLRARSSRWYFLSTLSREFEEIAHEAAEIPYLSRRKDGLLNIVGLILVFFSDNEDTGKERFFFFMKKIAEVNLNQALKRISRSEKQLLHYIFGAVTKHVRAGARFERNGNTVVDAGYGSFAPTGREASADEIVTLCSSGLSGRETPGKIVDMIFDRLRGEERFKSMLNISTLRTATFDLLKSKFIPPRNEITRNDPMQKFYESEMLRLAGEALEETVCSYHWREGGSADLRDVYRSAGGDYLREIVMHGDKPPMYETFSRHMKECDYQRFRREFRGSFQNFLSLLWNNFLKKIRAD